MKTNKAGLLAVQKFYRERKRILLSVLRFAALDKSDQPHRETRTNAFQATTKM